MKTITKDVLEVGIKRVSGIESLNCMDSVSVEEPLEIRIRHSLSSVQSQTFSQEQGARSIAVTMRTPGADQELALGFLYTEGIISSPTQVVEVKGCGCNVVEVLLDGDLEIDPSLLDRHSFIASSCGVCGKKSIEAVQARRSYQPKDPFPKVAAEIIHALPEKLRSAQKSFGQTGGLHASGLFDISGNLLFLREDVGRHNALDKLIGASAKSGLLPLEKHIILVSGRASFELVQKAAHAGATVLAAVGAPSTLAVELASASGMTLVGFVRNNGFNIYTGADAS